MANAVVDMWTAFASSGRHVDLSGLSLYPCLYLLLSIWVVSVPVRVPASVPVPIPATAHVPAFVPTPVFLPIPASVHIPVTVPISVSVPIPVSAPVSGTLCPSLTCLWDLSQYRSPCLPPCPAHVSVPVFIHFSIGEGRWPVADGCCLCVVGIFQAVVGRSLPWSRYGR